MIDSLDAFLEYIEIPSSCRLDKPVYKKLFFDNGVLDATDKKCLKDDVGRIRWLYTLKPSTINIAPYKDEIREYPEIAILHVELSAESRATRIANFFNRSIPYPLVLIFSMDDEGGTRIAISLADKRINQADKEKWVLEDIVHSGWISLADKTQQESDFLESLKITALPFADFWRFYEALMDRVIAMSCARHSGVFALSNNQSEKPGTYRLEKLRELERLDVQKSELTNKLKKEKQMGRQVELNMNVKKIKDRIADIKSNL